MSSTDKKKPPEQKPERFAAALGYQKNRDTAPKLLAKGKGLVADRIVEVAKDHHRPVYKDERLAKQLQNLQLGETIPESMYNVVAEVLIFISKVDRRYGDES